MTWDLADDETRGEMITSRNEKRAEELKVMLGDLAELCDMIRTSAEELEEWAYDDRYDDLNALVRKVCDLCRQVAEPEVT